MIVVAYCENSVQYVPPDGFYGIQIVQNSISAGFPPQTPSWLGGKYPLCIPYPFGVSLSTPLASNVGGEGPEIPSPTFERRLRPYLDEL